MADTVKTQDIVSVGSRVAWSAIVAGAVVALAIFYALSVLGVAIGLSVRGEVTAESMGWGSAIWSILTILIALFVGGMATTKLATRETRGEAVVYGIVLWGTMFAMMLYLASSGLATGFNAYLQAVTSTQSGDAVVLNDAEFEEMARESGLSDQQIEQLNERWNEARGAVDDVDPATYAWGVFAGLVLSILAAIGGAIMGSGPEIVMAHYAERRAVIVRKTS